MNRVDVSWSRCLGLWVVGPESKQQAGKQEEGGGGGCCSSPQVAVCALWLLASKHIPPGDLSRHRIPVLLLSASSTEFPTASLGNVLEPL